MIIDLVCQEMVKETAEEYGISLAEGQIEFAGMSAQKSIEDYGTETEWAIKDAIEEVSGFKFPKSQTEEDGQKKLFAFDIFEGDKGVIIADSMEEAEALFQKEYPERKIVRPGVNDKAYREGGCYITEAGTLDGTSMLFVTCPW